MKYLINSIFTFVVVINRQKKQHELLGCSKFIAIFYIKLRQARVISQIHLYRYISSQSHLTFIFQENWNISSK